jgi:hypothetical protein
MEAVMKWHKLVAMLVVAALLGGFIGVPVARATTVHWAGYAGIWSYDSTHDYLSGQIWMDAEMGLVTGGSFTLDGVSVMPVTGHDTGGQGYYYSFTYPQSSRYTFPYNAVVAINIWGTNWGIQRTMSLTYTGYQNRDVNSGGIQSGYATFVDLGGAPLSVSIAGPASIDKAVGGTWTASASGGIGPYTYLWDYRSTAAYLNYGTGAVAGASFHRVLTAGRWFIGVQATDSLGATATASLAVSSGSAVGAYSLHFTRYGDYGRFIDVTAWDATGEALEITGSSATQAGLSGTDGSFGWTSTANAVAVQNSLAWRYTISLTVGGAMSPPPVLFWLKGDITVTGGVVLSFQHEFLSLTEDYATILDAGGDPVLPETPPMPGSVEPVWLAWLIAKFKEMLTALFVPKMEDISKLLPTSYLVAQWCPIGPNTFANMTTDETFVLPVFGDLRFNLDEVPSGIWTACRVVTQVSIAWSLIWIMLGIIG